MKRHGFRDDLTLAEEKEEVEKEAEEAGSKSIPCSVTTKEADSQLGG